MQKNLHIPKKSSYFAPDLVRLNVRNNKINIINN